MVDIQGSISAPHMFLARQLLFRLLFVVVLYYHAEMFILFRTIKKAVARDRLITRLVEEIVRDPS